MEVVSHKPSDLPGKLTRPDQPTTRGTKGEKGEAKETHIPPKFQRLVNGVIIR